MLKKGGRVLPVRLHGVNLENIPPFLISYSQYLKQSGFIFPYDFAYRLDMEPADQFSLIAPSETLYSLTGIPRMAVGVVDKFIYTNVPEVDQVEAWTSLGFVQNFLRKRTYNTFRIFVTTDISALKYELESHFDKKIVFNLWEKSHSDLAWALNLESKIMFSLFISVIFLVSISIISGQLIFWSKIKQDLVGMWILGASRTRIFSSALVSFGLLNILAVLLGIVFATVGLKLFGLYGGDILPDIFVDRKVPIIITPVSLSLSFLLPVFISTLFCGYTLKVLMKDTDFLELLRA
jgi:lipoprotein-releasing system permease protein